ncbi:GatB/YqeY domain-containing protein [Wohlfahrtiimonas chitiniclastica]|uniref:GatB/YqeY domain-containing protein n=1 Tax=Wohlfahrtiimonas chitiniclastica TaxID=400946 RepID=UPI000372A612|nr:GatB/YqeY domain-containing protein [Wohlfahrtiimonas chitiniclastica]KZX37975.1 glutamyl-tRNA amidotransferase [Wohlfahrtiimonas chitiniclastica]MBS7813952.1 GatB/YqeY domain-containing protein [Wohlfahrtiimonas chitiniclastica]MBS7816215.1 GatB/YqeY domain-containing protein [Wohlfahrtiimonas chitiniclastica]MBS7821790.1 GatB/YqeY domain-containing protein [Wohlfahrtiimonas chitiniclastica]MBS7827758.1 GatB/YqeY domain-containing protein [Wohlfahrtiimonas chitiniclastica]
MSLKARIMEDIKTAMREKNKEKLATLRLISAEIKQVEVDQRIEMDDAAVTAVLVRMVKQRKESIDQFQKAERLDLVAQEESELSIIMPYLPEQMSQEDVEAAISEAIKATGALTMKDMGKVMGMLKPQLEGKADMGVVSKLLKAALNP